jgi:soluble lytic murein transglycosylase-like protein
VRAYQLVKTAAAMSAVLLSAAPARAELVFFTTGRVLSIKAHQADGEMLVLQLRGGGDMTIESRLIDRITPDEVPYPEPAPEPVAQNDTADDGRVTMPSAYDPLIDKYSKEQGVDAKLVRAVIQVESAYQQRARSRKGAIGLMQLMPATAQQYAADPYDPASNIEAGIKHLKGLLDRWPRDLALAAYNAGEAAVQRFRGIPPYPETRAYVTRILQLVSR